MRVSMITRRKTERRVCLARRDSGLGVALIWVFALLAIALLRLFIGG